MAGLRFGLVLRNWERLAPRRLDVQSAQCPRAGRILPFLDNVPFPFTTALWGGREHWRPFVGGSMRVDLRSVLASLPGWS